MHAAGISGGTTEQEKDVKGNRVRGDGSGLQRSNSGGSISIFCLVSVDCSKPIIINF